MFHARPFVETSCFDMSLERNVGMSLIAILRYLYFILLSVLLSILRSAITPKCNRVYVHEVCSSYTNSAPPSTQYLTNFLLGHASLALPLLTFLLAPMPRDLRLRT